MSARKTKRAAARTCFFVPVDAFVEGHGYRVSIVREDEPGHYPTGVWPNDGTRVMPYFWGSTYEEAERICEKQNERLGVSRRDAITIVASSMFPTKRGRR